MKSLRVLSYAINGRGMGHLVRQLAILRWIRRIAAFLDLRCELWVLTSSEADTLARREGVCAFKMPSKAMLRDAGIEPSRYLSVARSWTLNIMSGLQPSLLLVDTFPGGSFGELIAALEMAPQRVLVARRVRPEIAADAAYSALLPLYHRHIVPDDRDTGAILIREREELLARDRAREALGASDSDRVVYLTLGGGGDVAAPRALPRLAERLVERGWHVVVGAGPLYDGPEKRGPRLTWMSRYVPMELFAGFDVAVSAGGYNGFHELMYCGVPTVFLPQPRISDDQTERVERAEAAGAGRLAARLEDVPDLVAEMLADGESPGKARALVPTNGARAAALAALATVLPETDLALAERVLTPRLLASTAGLNSAATARVLDVVRILSGGTPSEVARRRALLSELADQGIDVARVQADLDARDADARVERFFDTLRCHEIPLDTAVTLLKGLRRKFPAASGAELADAIDKILATCGRFRDWMGAVSLLRAVPTQRSFPVAEFARGLADWLAHEEDLFDALRSFARLEGQGQRTVAEVVRLLRASSAAGHAAGEAGT